MNFTSAIGTALSSYADFSGRARRAEYWYFVLFYLLVVFGACVVDYGFLQLGTGPISIMVGLALLVPSWSVAARRLHDTDRSGWWLLLSFIPLIGDIVLLFWFCTRGTAGDNRFGPDPLTRYPSNRQMGPATGHLTPQDPPPSAAPPAPPVAGPPPVIRS